MSVNVDIEKALILKLETDQPFSPKLDVVGPLQAYRAETKQAYLRTSYFPNQTIDRSVAKGGPLQYTGIFQVLVVGPATGSSFELKAMADALAEDVFSKGTIVLTATGEKIKIYAEAWVSPLLPDPVWPSVPVSVPYSLVRIK